MNCSKNIAPRASLEKGTGHQLQTDRQITGMNGSNESRTLKIQNAEEVIKVERT